MSDGAWTKVISEKDLPDGKPTLAKIGEDELVLVRRGPHVYACGAKCSHYEGPLNKGIVVGNEIICPLHTARFDLSTGRKVSPPGLGPIASYETKSEDGEIFVRPRAGDSTGGGSNADAGAPPNTGTHAGAATKHADKATNTILLLGGGAAADTAAETLRMEGYHGRIVMITREHDVPYDRTVLSKGFLTGETKPEWVPLRGETFYKDNAIEILTGRRFTAFDPETRTVTMEDGSTLRGDQVLLASGSVPRSVDVPGARLASCFTLRSLADGRKLAERAAAAKHAVIIGSSFIGLETASSMRERKASVDVVAPERIPLERVFGEAVGKRVQAIHEAEGVTFHLGTSVKEIGGKDRVEYVVLANNTRIDADLVIIGVGVTPAVDYLEKSGLLTGGAVHVNERLETRAAGVFAAGDIAVVPDALNGGSTRIEHWVVAQRHGMHAARAMLGNKDAYAEPPFFWTMQFGNSIKFTGSIRSMEEIVFRGNVQEGSFSAGYFESGALRAVSTIGRARDVLIAGELLKGRVRVDAARFKNTEDLESLLP